MSQLITLSNGPPIPRIAYGTGTEWWVGKNTGQINQNLVQSLKTAFAAGFRHIDTAEIYGTEQDIGVALKEFLKESGLERKDFVINSKVGPGIANIAQAARECLDRLQLSYFDVFYIHAPFFSKFKYDGTLMDAWKAMEKLVDDGLAKAIAVSNYAPSHLQEILKEARIKPVINQVEFHPYLQQHELVKFCKEHNIAIASYGPLASIIYKPGGPVDPIVSELAVKYKKTEGQILLRWNYQKGNIVITTSSKPDRMKEILSIEEFELSPEDEERIDAAGSQLKYRKFWDKEFVD